MGRAGPGTLWTCPGRGGSGARRRRSPDTWKRVPQRSGRSEERLRMSRAPCSRRPNSRCPRLPPSSRDVSRSSCSRGWPDGSALRSRGSPPSFSRCQRPGESRVRVCCETESAGCTLLLLHPPSPNLGARGPIRRLSSPRSGNRQPRGPHLPAVAARVGLIRPGADRAGTRWPTSRPAPSCREPFEPGPLARPALPVPATPRGRGGRGLQGCDVFAAVPTAPSVPLTPCKGPKANPGPRDTGYFTISGD